MSLAPGTVTEVRAHARGSHRRTVWVDGDPWRAMPIEVVRRLGLCEGSVIELPVVEEEARSVEPALARERALRLLLYRDRSEVEVRRRLADDGYTDDVVHSVTSELVAQGLVDDRRFAESYARMLVLSRGLGRARALRELLHHGIPEESAVDLLDSLSPSQDEAARARGRAARLTRSGDTPARLAARLVRRGYDPAVALDAARHTVAARDVDQSDEEGA